MKKNIWILEDDQDFVELYKDFLGEDYTLTFFNDIPLFLNTIKIQRNLCDLAIVDLTIYQNNFLNHLNEANLLSSIPFMIVSGHFKKEFIDKSFEFGAIDYIIKPFRVEEIQSKISHYLIQNKKKSKLEIIIDEFIEKDILTQKEIKILNLFLTKEEYKLKRHEILDRIWKGIKVHPKTLDVHLYNLRKKIKEQGLTITCTDGVFNLEAPSHLL
jgi:DNA-binding response OmpR family regulator